MKPKLTNEEKAKIYLDLAEYVFDTNEFWICVDFLNIAEERFGKLNVKLENIFSEWWMFKPEDKLGASWFVGENRTLDRVNALLLCHEMCK